MNLMGDHDREAQRQAAREAVLQARLEAERPWWQKRSIAWLTAAPLRFWRWLKWWGGELGQGACDLLLTGAALSFVLAVGLLASRAWRTAPIPTAVLIASTVAFLAFGGVEFNRGRRRGRLAMIAMAAYGFVALWVVVPLLSSWPYLLF